MKRKSVDQRAIAAAIALLAIIVSICLYGCAENTSVSTGTSPTKSTIKTSTGISNRSVTSSINSKSPSINEFHPTVDSIVVTRARVVVSALQLHEINQSDGDTIIILLVGDKDDGNGKGHGKKHHENDDWNADDQTITIV